MEPNQDPNLATDTPPSTPRGNIAGVVVDALKAAAEFIDSAWLKINNLTQTNYDLACRMVARGQVPEAIRRFKITLWLAPGHIPSLYNLGCLYEHLGDKKTALDYFVKVLRINPQHQEAIFMVSSINPQLIRPEMRPRTMPIMMAVDYFDALAPLYDREQFQLGYRLPPLLLTLLNEVCGDQFQPQTLIDLGCGTGLIGAQFRERIPNIIGVDISDPMLNEAYKRFDGRGIKIYNRVIQQDLRHYGLHGPAEMADLVTCINVIPYIGDLAETVGGIARLLKVGGVAALSFPEDRAANPYAISPQTGYFIYALDYVLGLAEQGGLSVIRTGEVLAYPKINHQLCLFRKEKTHADNPPA